MSGWYTWTLLVVWSLVMAAQPMQAFGWKYEAETVTTCSLATPEIQKITEIFTEATSIGTNAVNISLVELDIKLQKVLDLMAALQAKEEKKLQVLEEEVDLDALDEVLVQKTSLIENNTQGILDEEKHKIDNTLYGMSLHNTSMVPNDTQDTLSEEHLNKEQTNVEPPILESLTDISELPKVNNELEEQEEEAPVEEKDHPVNQDKPEETVNENAVQHETSTNDDDDIALFRSPTNSNDVKKGGCEALVKSAHQTIGIFYITSFRHGHCSNREPLTSDSIRYCLGYCTSKTFLDRNMGHEWRQGHECYSCQPEEMELISIPLECEDGYTFDKKYSNVVSCKCQACKAVETAASARLVKRWT